MDTSTLIAFIIIVIGMGIYTLILFIRDYTVWHNDEHKIDITVRSRYSKKYYHSKRYRITSKGMELRIFNPYLSSYGGYSVGLFDNSLKIMKKVNPEYAETKKAQYLGNSITIDYTDGRYLL